MSYTTVNAMINKEVTKELLPIQKDIEKLQKELHDLKTRLTDNLEKCVELIETEKSQKEERMNVLTIIVVNIQRSINMLDSNECSTYLMVSGLKEMPNKIDGE